jgi:hypothetical protein
MNKLNFWIAPDDVGQFKTVALISQVFDAMIVLFKAVQSYE